VYIVHAAIGASAYLHVMFSPDQIVQLYTYADNVALSAFIRCCGAAAADCRPAGRAAVDRHLFCSSGFAAVGPG